MADITADLGQPPKASKAIERVKRELYRRANDKLKVFNPTDKDATSSWDGFAYTVKAKSEGIFPRYIAQKYIRDMIHNLIGLENTERVTTENARRVKTGQKPMNLYEERFDFDLKKNDENLWKKYMPQVYGGVVEQFGVDVSSPGRAASADSRPMAERLMEDITEIMDSEPETPKEPPPLKVDDEDFEEPADFNVAGIDEKKDDLIRGTAE